MTDPRGSAEALRAAQAQGALGLGEDGGQFGGSVPKLFTGIAGFDDVTMGGLPRRRATVVAGQAGSAKTVFAGQFLAEGVRRGQPGVFVTLEEPAADLRANLTTLGYELAAWEQAGDWEFVDASPLVRSGTTEHTVVPYSLETLAAQIGHAVDKTGAERLALDSLNAVLSLNRDPLAARQMLRSLIADLRAMGLTVMLTVETADDPGGALSSYGIEEFVADNVVLLHNVREGKVRRRTVEVLKMRGAMHHKGEVPFTILPGKGVVVLPMSRAHRVTEGAARRVTAGNDGVNAMLRGGLFAGSTLLVSGATGTGKTLMASEFLAGGLAAGEQVLLLAYEESRDQILRNASGWGLDFAGYEEAGQLTVFAMYPEVASLDDHLVEIGDLIDRVQPTRVAIDSLSALERLGSDGAYREFVIRLTSLLKRHDLAALLTAATPTLLGGTSVTEGHVSALTDSIILLRYVEVFGAVRRGIAVLKMRGSPHDNEIREFTISDHGMHVGGPFQAITGILTGQIFTHVEPNGPKSRASR